MISFLLGVGALLAFLFLARLFVAANPANVANGLRAASGIFALSVGGLLTVTGRGGFGLPLVVVGVGLLARFLQGRERRTRRRPGGTSRVRSASLAMELDLDSGNVRGEVLKGQFAGRSLDSLNDAELSALTRELSSSDSEGLSLLETYLDRRKPGWREDLKRDQRAGHRNPAREGAMTKDEAYQILGLDPRAGPDEIRRAHRVLMQKLHPDRGGSTWLASRVNQAKDVLLRDRG